MTTKASEEVRICPSLRSARRDSEHPAPDVLIEQHSGRLLLGAQLRDDVHRGAQQQDGSPRAEQIEERECPAGELDHQQDGDANAECIGFGHGG